jgi:hypothetical protein
MGRSQCSEGPSAGIMLVCGEKEKAWERWWWLIAD